MNPHSETVSISKGLRCLRFRGEGLLRSAEGVGAMGTGLGGEWLEYLNVARGPVYPEKRTEVGCTVRHPECYTLCFHMRSEECDAWALAVCIRHAPSQLRGAALERRSRGGPILEPTSRGGPVLASAHRPSLRRSVFDEQLDSTALQGYLAQMKPPSPRSLQ